MSGDAQRLINVIRDTMNRSLGSVGRSNYRYGQIIDGGGAYEVSAYIDGDSVSTDYIRQLAGGYVGSGDYVILIATNEGDIWVDQVLPFSLYSRMVLDYNRSQIILGDGDTPPSDPGIEGQVLKSGGPNSSAYWDWS